MLWLESRRMSADEISAEANLRRLTDQRQQFRMKNWPFLAKNHQHSVFYQVDLEEAAHDFAIGNIAKPHPLTDSEPLLTRIHDAMFRSEYHRQRFLLNSLEKDANEASFYEKESFSLLREGLTQYAKAHPSIPRMSVCDDQIVWGRSPVRIDIAGGWTDTPPFCLREGGNVINLSMREFDLLAFLCTHPNTALTKDKILSEVWGAFSEVEPKTLAVHIRWLREKLEDNPEEPQFIKTVFKVGYILDVEI